MNTDEFKNSLKNILNKTNIISGRRIVNAVIVLLVMMVLSITSYMPTAEGQENTEAVKEERITTASSQSIVEEEVLEKVEDESEKEKSGKTSESKASENKASENKASESKASDSKTSEVEEPLKILEKEELLGVIEGIKTEEKIIYASQEYLLETKEVKELQEILDTFFEEGNRAGFLMLDLNSGEYLCSGTEHIYYGASVLKGPYVAAINKYEADTVNEQIKTLMQSTIEFSDNDAYGILRQTYGTGVLYKMTDYTKCSADVVDEYNWYPDMKVEDLAKLWVGTYWYFFEETNDNSEWCRGIYTNSTQSFINSALSEDYKVYSKAGWICDEYDVARNDGGIVIAGKKPYILVIMSEAFEDYENLEKLAEAVNEVHKIYYEGK